MNSNMIPQIASALEAADAEEQRILAGVATLLSNLLQAKQQATEIARADLAAIINPNSAPPKTQAELDAEYFGQPYRRH